MRLVIQRVNKAKVRIIIDGKRKTVGEIEKGLFILVGIAKGDSEKNAEVLAEKLIKLRVMSDKLGKMNLSVSDTSTEILVISQFTLHADTSRGNRPSFIKAAKPKVAEKIYNRFVSKLKEFGVKVETGQFGEYMQINAQLDGPVTLLLDSNK